LADPLTTVAPEELLEVLATIVRVQRDHGDRHDREHARLKYLIHDWGIDRFGAEVAQRLGRSLPAPEPVVFVAADVHLGWHPQGDGRWFLGVKVENGGVADRGALRVRSGLRMTERNMRPASALLQRDFDLDASIPLGQPRPPERRVVGTCRHYAVLATSFLRATGVPARARCGFAEYCVPPKKVDYWITEYWSDEDQRWIRIDPEYLDRTTPGLARPDDLGTGEFLDAGEAWQLVRSGQADPAEFGVFGTENWGAGEIRGNALRDLASLARKREMLPWDEWGPMAVSELAAQAKAIVACDTFVVDTVMLRQVNVLFCGRPPARTRTHPSHPPPRRPLVPPPTTTPLTTCAARSRPPLRRGDRSPSAGSAPTWALRRDVRSAASSRSARRRHEEGGFHQSTGRHDARSRCSWLLSGAPSPINLPPDQVTRPDDEGTAPLAWSATLGFVTPSGR
jgi:hypothetical protein